MQTALNEFRYFVHLMSGKGIHVKRVRLTFEDGSRLIRALSWPQVTLSGEGLLQQLVVEGVVISNIHYDRKTDAFWMT
jgi:hypothetical protein